MMWNGMSSAPRDRLIVFAVPVFGSEHHPTQAGEFLRWDTWTDDPSDDWSDEREIGWCMNDAVLWCECPPVVREFADGRPRATRPAQEGESDG